MHRTSIALALLLITSAVSAQVYKWKDASGTVHYSETPPAAQSTKYKQVKTAVDTPAAPAAATSTATPPPAAPAQTTVADTPDNRVKLCASLKTNLAALQGTAPVVMNQDGKQTALDAAQRKQQADASQAQYQQYCAK